MVLQERGGKECITKRRPRFNFRADEVSGGNEGDVEVRADARGESALTSTWGPCQADPERSGDGCLDCYVLTQDKIVS